MRDHIRANRIKLDVAHYCQQVAFAVYDGRSITSFPKGAAALVVKVEILHISAPHGLEYLADAVFGARGCQKVDMIRHPHVGVHGQIVFDRRINQRIAEKLIVFVGCKDGLPVYCRVEYIYRVSSVRLKLE